MKCWRCLEREGDRERDGRSSQEEVMFGGMEICKRMQRCFKRGRVWRCLGGVMEMFIRRDGEVWMGEQGVLYNLRHLEGGNRGWK